MHGVIEAAWLPRLETVSNAWSSQSEGNSRVVQWIYNYSMILAIKLRLGISSSILAIVDFKKQTFFMEFWWLYWTHAICSPIANLFHNWRVKLTIQSPNWREQIRIEFANQPQWQQPITTEFGKEIPKFQTKMLLSMTPPSCLGFISSHEIVFAASIKKNPGFATQARQAARASSD